MLHVELYEFSNRFVKFSVPRIADVFLMFSALV